MDVLNMTVGQTDLRKSVKSVLAEDIKTPAYFKEYRELEEKTKNNIKNIFKSDDAEIILKVGTGTLGLESVLCSVLEQGDKVLIVNQGHWSSFLGRLAELQKAQVKELKVDERKGYADPQMIEEELKENIDIKLVAVVHSETNTGVLNPIENIGPIAKKYGAYFMVDAISSFGGVEIDLDNMRIDFCVTIGQKCLNAPQGMPIIAVSKKGMELVKSRRNKIKSPTLDLTINKPSYILTKSLYAATQDIIDEGIENVFSRHKKVSKALRKAIREMGLEVYASEGRASPTCTRIEWPEWIKKRIEKERKNGIDLDFITRNMLEKHGVSMGEDRLGTMGEFATSSNIYKTIEALGNTLKEFDLDVNINEAKEKARQILDQENE